MHNNVREFMTSDVALKDFQRSTKNSNRHSLNVLGLCLYEAVVSDLLKNPKLNGGSTTMTAEAKRTLARACKDTLPEKPLWVGTKFKLEPSPQDTLQN
jgi:hypothetical protein